MLAVGRQDHRFRTRECHFFILQIVPDLLELNSGKTITLALEPEPCCYLETVEDAVAFFRDFLRHPELVGELARELGLSVSNSERAVRRHIGLCYDACHMAVQFEEPEQAISNRFVRWT